MDGFLRKTGLIFINFFIIVFPLPIGKDDTIKEKESSLEYSYTRFNSSYYEVVARLDEEVVDFYSTVTKLHMPKKKWNEEPRSFSHTQWEDSIPGRMLIDKEWFPRFAKVIGEHMISSGDGDATVQMRLGCSSQGGSEPRSFAELAYRGESLLSYRQKPVAPWVLSPGREGPDRPWPEAESVQQDFNNVNGSWQKPANDKIAEFLNKTCFLNLDLFSKYEKVNKSKNPRIEPRGHLGPGQSNLSCLVTGFYPRSTDISMRWFKDGVRLVEGIWSTGVRPSANHTYQIRTGLVTDTDDTVYHCEVDYPDMIRTTNHTWTPEPKNSRTYWYLLVVLLVAAVFLITLVVVYCVRKRVPEGGPDQCMTVMVQEDPGPDDILRKDTSDTGSDNTGRDEAYGSGDSCDVSTEELALLSRPRAEQQTGPPASSLPPASL